MKAYGAEVIVIEKPDPEKGYLGSRLNYIRKTLMSDNNLVWTNQYECPDNSEAHARLTARELLIEFPVIDYLFVAAGTTGTLMGCVQTITEESPATKIIAVDTEGSVIFGTPPAPRYIPGMGASVPPPLFDSKNLFDMVQVSEMDTVQTCRMVAQRYGFLAGGSTGTVLTAIQHYSHKIPTGSVVAMISPDGGERYIDTIYSDEWCRQKGLLRLFGDWNTIYRRFNLWSKKGVLLQLFTALKQSPDFEWAFIDGSIVSAHQHATGASTDESESIGKSRGGNTTKIHLAVDSYGLPIFRAQ